MQLKYDLILDIVKSFYDKATTDILIGYHFRFIDDFDSHFPRIADFWQLQLTGNMDHPESKPFDIISKHAPLKVKRGEIDRWALLFDSTLEEYVASNKISEDIRIEWMRKVKIFQKRMYTISQS